MTCNIGWVKGVEAVCANMSEIVHTEYIDGTQDNKITELPVIWVYFGSKALSKNKTFLVGWTELPGDDTLEDMRNVKPKPPLKEVVIDYRCDATFEGTGQQNVIIQRIP